MAAKSSQVLRKKTHKMIENNTGIATLCAILNNPYFFKNFII